ncbi:baseplate J/gp47 family protein [Veillonella rogosae]|uniref:baseplate J/gp47 family protein n=1 Tax=Veillonella rogosae TaxID=423477 RepID=UPI0006CFC60B|nr:baseplate J/gp47 family protein [Veillonella rogosae]
MYENKTYENLLADMLYRVNSKYDKREGSMIYDGVAPAAFEFAEAYIMARAIIKQTYAKTADRDFLALRAIEFNIVPREATTAEVKGKFSQAVDIGTRFNYEDINFRVTDVIDLSNNEFKLICETPGAKGNYCIGRITPINTIPGLQNAEIKEVLVPGQDEEDTEAFRERYIRALKSKAYGGNGADYKEKVLTIAGTGGSKIYRCWNGGGTVKVVLINNEFNKPSQELVKEVQNVFDPTPNKGKGYGLAPIGHTVTVEAAQEVVINYEIPVVMTAGHEPNEIKEELTKRIEERLKARRKEWTTQDENQYLTVRTSIVTSLAVDLDKVVDVAILKLTAKKLSASTYSLIKYLNSVLLH